jgi:hypothetical protein
VALGFDDCCLVIGVAGERPMRQAKRGDFTASYGVCDSKLLSPLAAAGKAERTGKGAEAAARHAGRA